MAICIYYKQARITLNDTGKRAEKGEKGEKGEKVTERKMDICIY
jgi:hypothetical protein